MHQGLLVELQFVFEGNILDCLQLLLRALVLGIAVIISVALRVARLHKASERPLFGGLALPVLLRTRHVVLAALVIVDVLAHERTRAIVVQVELILILSETVPFVMLWGTAFVGHYVFEFGDVPTHQEASLALHCLTKRCRMRPVLIVRVDV